MDNEARVSRDPELGPYYNEQKIQSTRDGLNPMIYPNVDWYDVLFNRYTINTKANVNVFGGGKVATYFVSTGYDKETGLLKVDNRNNFNNKLDINRLFIRAKVIFKLYTTPILHTPLQRPF